MLPWVLSESCVMHVCCIVVDSQGFWCSEGEYFQESLRCDCECAVGFDRDFDACFSGGFEDWLESRLQPILETAAKTGVKIAIEPHGAFTVTSQGLLKILALGTPETLGVNYDTANVHNATFGQNPWQHKPGFDEIDVLKSVADSVIHCHVKDYSNGKSCTPGTGIAKVAQCLDILKNSGYTGAISLETEGEHDFQQAEQIAKDAFKFLAKWG